ncbi:thyrotropin-releasing hormone-degrading ectoenzyme-like [Physella acuta]|uniref:thyrotropin-releasing hormone-degrading ectoenzyme-like n=1 Tax=Physella acuta TaxID=109671 RepID=UPI0027DD6103|nr:thyrotropin-releasing hormone-degrading ectoenzyme-like [Physella acuta]
MIVSAIFILLHRYGCRSTFFLRCYGKLGPSSYTGRGFMLYQARVSTVKTMKNVAIITSHELAHQWFGNLVTPAWWDDLWLNEGFATFLEFLGVDRVHPEWNILDTMVVDDIMKALVQDGTPASVPLFSHVASVKDLDKIPSTITYQKGCAIIRMVDYILGRDTFKKALHTYLNQYQYGSVTHDDLWEVLSQQARRDGKDLDVKGIMDTWILQMNYPVVTVQRSSHTADQVLVSQKRYLEDYTAADPEIFTSPYGYKWTIPLTLTSSRNPYFNQTDRDILWLHWTSRQSEITIRDLPELSDPNAWILANVQMYGFYRVNYAASNWLALCRQLMEDHLVIPAVNRAQIIHDAWSLVKSGDLEISIALKTIEYLHKEREYAPLFVAQRELVYVRNMLILTPVFGALHVSL